MVHLRASTGCDECRLQHTKCDGVSPSCGRCLRRGIVCPGYRHVGGFVFKTQTNYDSKSRRCVQQETVSNKLNRKSNLGSRDPDRFIAFFFDKYVFAGRQSDSSCGLFDHAAMFCNRALPSSTLVQAARVLGATTFITSRRLEEDSFTWYHELRLNAIRSMHRDIQSETSRVRDDTLLAVLLLDFTEAIIRGHMGSRIPLSHQKGALALLRLRGTLNFRTPEAISLYNAVRYATLRGSSRPAETAATLQALDLLAKLEKVNQPPALQLLDMFDKISTLQCALEAIVAKGQPISHLHSLVLEIQASLDGWPIYLPPRWVPNTIVFQNSTATSPSSPVEQYESIDIAFVYNLWRCACLKLERSNQVFDQVIPPSPRPLVNKAERIFDGIRQAVPAFLGLLHGSEYVEQDELTRAWKESSYRRKERGMQRFPGDHLSKWFLLDLLDRLEQIIGDGSDVLPKLHVLPETLIFLDEQKRILSDLSPSTIQQLTQIFSECRALV